jgi:hypothetical protein
MKILLRVLLLIALLIPVGVLSLSSSPVEATTPIPWPDTTNVTIESAHIYKNYLELGDVLVVVRYYMKWAAATQPTLTIDQTFIGETMNGTIELANIAPYSYYSNGYNHGVFSMYFTAAQAAALIVWGDPYAVTMIGNPTLSWTLGGVPNAPPYVSSVTLTWHNTASISATSLLLGANVVSWATTLSNQWVVALTTTTPSGAKLSSYGDQYFTNTIPNLRAACPQIFTAGSSVPTFVESTGVPTPYTVNSSASWPFPAGVLGDTNWRAFGYMLVCVGLLAYGVGLVAHRFDLGTLVAVVTIPVGAKLGAISVTFVVMLVMLCIVALLFELVLQHGAT